MPKILYLLLCCLLLAACTSQEATRATVESRVALAVAATIDAWPPATAAPTLTPAPSYTPRPTLTAVPTTTPWPTLTPAPTLTPNPTYTPPPTIPPTETATAARVVAGAPAASPATAHSFTVLAIRLVRLRMVAMVDNLLPTVEPRSAYDPTIRSDPSVDCVKFIDDYERFRQLQIPPTGATDPAVQHAYQLYKSGVDQFDARITGWLDSCRTAIANNETRNFESGAASSILITGLLQDIELLLQAEHALEPG